MEKSSSAPSGERYWDGYCALIVFLLVQVAAARLQVTDWIPNLAFAGTLGFLGVALGLALGYSRFQRPGVFWLSLIYSLVVPSLQLTGAIEAEAPLGERLASLAGRLWYSMLNLVAAQPVDDALFFLSFISLVFWVISLYAGYSLTRHKDPLAIILPGGIVTLIIQSYDGFVPARTVALAVYIFLSLVLLGRLFFANQQPDWKKRRVFVAPDAEMEIQNHLLIVAGLVILGAWLLPGSLTSLRAAAQTWERLSRPARDRLSDAVSALDSPFGSGQAYEFYGETLLLGRNAALGEQPILSVRIITSRIESPPRYYWRGRIYDTYSAGNWRTLETGSQSFQPQLEEIQVPVYPDQQPIRGIVTVEISKQALMYATGEASWINRPGSVVASPAMEGAFDVTAWLADPLLLAGDRYEFRTRIVNPSIEELRAAGINYPDWIKQRYLQIPGELIEPFRQIAAEIIPDKAETAYDQATAITTYLRNEIAYSTELPPLPADKDPVLWVLTDYKQGFCMYAASAEVLLLRAQGIPARLAVGFAQGVLENGNYHVQRDDSHAWPEVFFPNIGWVEFEPTAIRSPLVRPLRSRTTDLIEEEPANNIRAGLTPPADGRGAERAEEAFQETGHLSSPFWASTAGRLTIIGLALILILSFVYINARYQFLMHVPIYLSRSYTRSGTGVPRWLEGWIRWNTLSSTERSFQAINLSLIWLGGRIPASLTAAQRADRLQNLLPSAQAEIVTLARAHQTVLYTPQIADSRTARRAALKLLLKSVQAKMRWKSSY